MTCTLSNLFHQNPGPQQAKGMVPFCLRHLILSAECCAGAGRLWVWATTHPSEKLCASAGKCCHFQIASLLLLKTAEMCLSVCAQWRFWKNYWHIRSELSIIPKDFALGCVSDLLSRWVASLHHFGVIGALFFRNVRKMPAAQTRKISKRAHLDNL